MELSERHALDQGPQDLFPQDGWEDPGGFEAGSAIDRCGTVAGAYTDTRVDDRLSNVSFAASEALRNRCIVGQMGTVSRSEPVPRPHMCPWGGYHGLAWDGQQHHFDPQRVYGQGGAPSYLPTYEMRGHERSRTGSYTSRSAAREQSVAPMDVTADQNATLFARFSQAQQRVQQGLTLGALPFCRLTHPSSWVRHLLRHPSRVVQMPTCAQLCGSSLIGFLLPTALLQIAITSSCC